MVKRSSSNISCSTGPGFNTFNSAGEHKLTLASSRSRHTFITVPTEQREEQRVEKGKPKRGKKEKIGKKENTVCLSFFSTLIKKKKKKKRNKYNKNLEKKKKKEGEKGVENKEKRVTSGKKSEKKGN